MSKDRYDCIVIGLGGHGSAALYHLAQKGVKVLGIEQHDVAHDKGSSHGESRIIRIAYHEHPDYVPLLKRAWDLWLDLQQKSNKFLLCDTKCIEACHPDLRGGSNCFTKALHSAQLHALEHEVLNAEEVNQRFPGYQMPPEFKAFLGPGGILASERCIAAHIEQAEAHGAEVRLNERVTTWQTAGTSGDVKVTTDQGQYRAKHLVLAAGSWNAQLVPELEAVLKVERQVIGWFEVLEKGCFDRASYPVGIIDSDMGDFYYFPVFEEPGMKIGKFNHLREDIKDPASLDRRVTARDEQVLRDGIAAWFPAANGKMLKAAACMFTNTPDHHFIVDRHPNLNNVIICSACSGHGYKFCSVVGEMIADMVCKGGSPLHTDIVKIVRSRKGFDELLKRFEVNASRQSRL